MSAALAWTLGVMALLAFSALIVAAIVSTAEFSTGQKLLDDVGESAKGATGKVCGILDQNLPDERLIAAKLTGATEFIHALPTVGEVRQPSGIPAAAMTLAGVLILTGAFVAVVDRVESRREVNACLDALPTLDSRTVSTTSSTTSTTSQPSATTNTGVGASAATASSPPAASTTSVAAAAVLSATSEPTNLTASDAVAFLQMCMDTADGKQSGADSSPEGSSTRPTRLTSTTIASSPTTTTSTTTTIP